MPADTGSSFMMDHLIARAKMQLLHALNLLLLARTCCDTGTISIHYCQWLPSDATWHGKQHIRAVYWYHSRGGRCYIDPAHKPSISSDSGADVPEHVVDNCWQLIGSHGEHEHQHLHRVQLCICPKLTQLPYLEHML